MDKEKQERIVEWLSQSKEVVIPNKSGSGFFVNRGTRVRLKSGEQIDALDWLLKEGFHNNMVVGEYSIKYAPQSEEFSEKMLFFKITKATPAPF